MFTLLVCGDIYGQKQNLELTFPALPTIGELTRRAEEVFTAEMRLTPVPPHGPGPQSEFRVSRVQIYDDVLLKWVDLISSTQLHEYDQLYIFQPQTPWHSDSQQDLPAPRPPTAGAAAPGVTSASYGGSPAPQHQPQPSYGGAHYQPQAAPPYMPPQSYGHAATAPASGNRPDLPLEQKAEVVMRDLDPSGKGYIEYAEMERSFREVGLDFSANTVGELFYKADLNRDGRITLDEWQNWSRIYPNTLDCMYFRAKNSGEEGLIRAEVARSQDQIAQNENQAQMLRRELADLAASSDQCRQRAQDQERVLAELAGRKMQLTAEERDLLEEEIKLERQRDQMRLQQARFKEVSERFDRDAAAKGSPRRARDVPPGY
eukprot:TRINITY_DN1525_c0_g2_i2.p1 TRINITY_DN1525_c0_g2~~TRINITY_DN1525_c0_g2_i2.p1  ORF type:complete len:409 (+),score=139.85 TRINITY_DN1525_c0_g2_i2:106-1227(+)